MSYPHAVATGNELIAAALAMDDASTAWMHAAMRCSNDTDDVAALAAEQAEHDYNAAVDRFEAALVAHRSATAAEHVQGPDMDADS